MNYKTVLMNAVQYGGRSGFLLFDWYDPEESVMISLITIKIISWFALIAIVLISGELFIPLIFLTIFYIFASIYPIIYIVSRDEDKKNWDIIYTWIAIISLSVCLLLILGGYVFFNYINE